MIQRFIKAQEAVWPRPIDEIRSGRKRTRWMQFVFPQMKGIGHSERSIYYGIKSEEEAREFYNHPVLGTRLREITQAVLDLNTDNIRAVFEDDDHLKLYASMTLFNHLSPDDIFADVLRKYFHSKCDARTLKQLGIYSTQPFTV